MLSTLVAIDNDVDIMCLRHNICVVGKLHGRREMQYNLVTPDEFAKVLMDLDKKQESRLYTVRDNLKNHFDDKLEELKAEIHNGHRG